MLEHGGGDVQREVAALGQAVAWQSSASRITAELERRRPCRRRARPGSSARWGSRCRRRRVKRASASAPTTRPVARSTIGWKATSSPNAVDQRCMRARTRSRRCGVEASRAPAAARARSRSAIRFAVSSSSNSRSFSATAMKPISRPTAGTANWPARSARLAHQAPSKACGADDVGERVERREDHHRDHAHVAPGHRAAGAPPPEGGDAGLRDHDGGDERAHRGGEAVVRREIAERGGGNGGPGEEEGTQAAEDEQGAELRLPPASAMPRRGEQREMPEQVARGVGVGALVDRAAVREQARQREQRQ